MPDTRDLVVTPDIQPIEVMPVDREQEGDSLATVLQQRWRTMLVVSILVAVVSIAAIGLLLQPKYKVSAGIHIAPVVRPILFSDHDTDISRYYGVYVSTEMRVMTSAAVISSALELPEVAALPSVRLSPDPVADIADKIEVEQVRGTQLLTMSMVGQNPEGMAVIVNAITQTYLRRHEDKKRELEEQILSSLRAEQSQLEAKHEAKAVQIRQSAVGYGLGTADGSGTLVDAWIAEVQALLTEASKDRALAKARLVALGANQEQDGTIPSDPSGFREALANDPEYLSLRKQYRSVELSALNDDRLGRGPNHPEVFGRSALVAALAQRIEQRQAALRDEHVRAEQYHWELKRRDAELSAQVFNDELERLAKERSGVAGQQFEIENLRHEREQLERALSQVRQKIWNVSVEQHRVPRVTFDSPALAPKTPNIDKRTKYSAAAFMMSLFMGAGVALLRHRLDTSFRSPAQVAQRLGVRVLGSVAYADPSTVSDSAAERQMLEPIRGISAALLADASSTKARCRLITSPTRGTGKSSMAANLAKSLASTGRRVLLVDADNHGQGITRRMGLSKKAGLREFLANQATRKEVLRSIGPGALDFVPAGTPDDEFGELLAKVEAQVKLKDLFASYDDVIVDSPPVLARSDTIILATLVDDVVLVLRAGRSTREEAIDAQHDLATVGGKVIGVVLNAVDPKTARYGYGYGYGYGNVAED